MLDTVLLTGQRVYELRNLLFVVCCLWFVRAVCIILFVLYYG